MSTPWARILPRTSRPVTKTFRPSVRSRKQHPSTACTASVDVPHLRVHVQGRPWSSVAVDVPTDVGQGGSSIADSDRRPAGCQTADSGSAACRAASAAIPDLALLGLEGRSRWKRLNRQPSKIMSGQLSVSGACCGPAVSESEHESFLVTAVSGLLAFRAPAC
jgi:hypothetical protein